MSDRIYYSHEAETKAKREMSLLIFITLVLGACMGSLLALLFAPKEGDAIRSSLANMLETRLGTVENQLNEMRGKMEHRVKELT